MDYTLAKQLKEAGFPKLEGAWDEIDEELIQTQWDFYGLQPNLSELIEACGDKFGGIMALHSARGTTYKAFEGLYMIPTEPSMSFHDFLKGEIVHGSSAEEAVARLWLALTKK